MKKIIFVCITILAFNAKAQLKVGYNVKNIQTNTNLQVESSTGQQFVITRDSSKVGIGTLNPTTKLEVIGTIKITDGTQGNGKVLISDANGQASWQNASSIQSTTKDSTSGSNGLTLSGKDVQLGGTLTKATSITTSATNTIAFVGLQSGVTNDSVMVINPSTGTLRRISPIVLAAANEPWFNVATNAGATANSQNIYQMGNVGIGATSPIGKLVVNDNAYISNLPFSSTHLMDNTTYRPLSRLQVTSGANNNALSTYATTAAFAMQAHNYSTGNSLRLILQPIGGSVGIGSDQPIGQLANHGTNYIASIGTGVVGNNFSWSSALGGTMATLYNSGTQGNATTLLVGSAGTTTNSLIEASTGVNSSSIPTRNIFIVKGNGNIGIHKSIPTQQLHIGNSGNVTANKTYNGTTDEGLSFVHYINTGADNNNNFSRVADIVVASPTSASAGAGLLRFLTSTNAEAGGNIVEKMRIHTNGYVGIGTSSPQNQLSVATNNSVPLLLERFQTGDLNSGLIIARSSSNIVGTHSALNNNELIGGIRFQASNGTAYPSADNARIIGITDGNQTTSNAGGSIAFFTAESGTTTTLEKMRIAHNGNVGIGTTSPTQQLHLGSNGSISSNKTYNGASDEGVSLNHYVNISTENSNTYTRIADFVVASPTTGTAGAGLLRFLTSTNAEAGSNIVEKMRIHTNGYVGIGTSSPQNQLSVASNNSVPLLLERFQSGDLNSGLIIARSSSNIVGTHSALNNNELIGGIRFQASNGSAYPSADNARIIGITDGNQTTSNAGGSIAFFTAESGTTTTLEKMRIAHNGNIGIGTSTPNFKLMIVDSNSGGASRVMIRNKSVTANSAADFLAQNNTGTNLQMGITSSTSTTGNSYTGVSGTASFLKSTAGPLYLYAGSVGVYLAQGSSSWTSNSDKRIKRDIQKLENGLSKLLTLSGYTYNYITDSDKEQKRVGLIAQEVQEVLPESISVNNDGILGVRYAELTPLIIEAVKDLKNELDLKNKELLQQKIIMEQVLKELEVLKAKIK